MKPMRGGRAVVMGGAGFLGSHLCDRLLAEGARVVCVDNLCTGNPANLLEASRSPRFELREVDISQPFGISGPVDWVFNLASPASPVDYHRLPIETLRVGAFGTEHGLQLARAKGAVFLQASTSEIYGDPLVHPQREDYFGNVNPIGPRAVYDEAKRYGEALVSAYRRRYGTETRIVRIFNTYGPRMRLQDGRVVPAFLGQALRGEPLTVFGEGKQTRSFCYVDDLIEGILRVAEGKDPLPFNLGNPQEVSILTFAETVRRELGSTAPIAFHPLPEGDPKRRRPDISRARSILGWEPRVPLEEGLRRTVAWFRAGQGAINPTTWRENAGTAT